MRNISNLFIREVGIQGFKCYQQFVLFQFQIFFLQLFQLFFDNLIFFMFQKFWLMIFFNFYIVEFQLLYRDGFYFFLDLISIIFGFVVGKLGYYYCIRLNLFCIFGYIYGRGEVVVYQYNCIYYNIGDGGIGEKIRK